MPAGWAARYVGLPYTDRGRTRSGVDCWGLVRLVYAEQFGLILPSYDADYDHSDDVRRVGTLILREQQSWRHIEKGKELPGDVIVMKLKRLPYHVGIVLGGGYMLHIERGAHCCKESYETILYKNGIDGFRRHNARDMRGL